MLGAIDGSGLLECLRDGRAGGNGGLRMMRMEGVKRGRRGARLRFVRYTPGTALVVTLIHFPMEGVERGGRVATRDAQNMNHESYIVIDAVGTSQYISAPDPPI